MSFFSTTEDRDSPPRSQTGLFILGIWKRWHTPLLLALAAVILYFIRFGYDYGNSDQDEILPYLLHLIQPELFTKDWFVQLQDTSFNIRFYFVLLLRGLAGFLPVWLAVFIVYLFSWIAIATALYRLVCEIVQNHVSAAVSVIAVLVITPQWTLGGNELVHTMLVPSMGAWALCLWAILLFLKSRYVPAALFLGLATLFQALVGLQVAGLLGLTMVTRRLGLQKLITFGGLYVVFALPALIPIGYQQLSGFRASVSPEVSLFHILAEFRNPHHYLPFRFHLTSYLRFGAILTAGTPALLYLNRSSRLFHKEFLIHMLILIGFVCLMATFFTEVIPVLFITKLQLFSTTVLAKVILVTATCGALGHVITDRFTREPGGIPFGKVLDVGLFFVILSFLAVVLIKDGFLESRVASWQRSQTPLGEIEAWARSSTPPDAVFAIPPSVSSFRAHAERAIVINFKAFPYRDDQIFEWHRRLMDVAPLAAPHCNKPSVLPQLDHAYEKQDAASLSAVANRYDVDYFVKANPLPPHPSFREVFASGEWSVFAYVKRVDPR